MSFVGTGNILDFNSLREKVSARTLLNYDLNTWHKVYTGCDMQTHFFINMNIHKDSDDIMVNSSSIHTEHTV